MSPLTHLLHPHHVNLTKAHHTSVQTLFQHVDDPYYALDHQPSHKDVAVPKFDVRENSTAFFLNGEFPGLMKLSDVLTEFVEKKTVIIRVTLEEWRGEVEKEAGKGKEAEGAKVADEPKSLFKERHVGKFERSFTFPVLIKPDQMKVSLEAGILTIMLPKDTQGENVEEARRVIAAEFSGVI
ncbi:hypothetical protein BGZ60DRAFT_402441 [Tricladium varicosporioides]|nr:hypothetical protein BGZ60DRAFT_402441 [Hymenoscyphus varicosporioides]